MEPFDSISEDFIFRNIKTSENSYFAVFSHTGVLLNSNKGFFNLIKKFDLTNNPKNIFLTPKFEDIVKNHSNKIHKVEKTYITVGNASNVYLSLYSTISYENEKLYFFGEINADEMVSINREYILMNNEIQNLNRKLIKKDIEIEKALAKLNELNQQLQEANEQKNRFIGIAAHEFRGPIGAIQTLLNIYIEDNKEILEEETVSTFKLMIETLGNTLEVVNDFLSISNIEAGSFSLNLESIDYHAFLKSIIYLNIPLGEKKDIEISLDYLASTQYIKADKGKLSQVLNNLISNGIKYSNSKSKIEIKVTDEGEYITTHVIDQGKGIRADETSNLFIYFSKTSTTTTAGESSTGIGLAISKKIIEAHNGIIGVKSGINKGSTFYFKLKK